MRKLHRYQTSARRAYNAAFKQLQALQGDRFDRQPSSLPEPILESPQTEPEPTSEPAHEPKGSEPKLIAFTPRNTKLQSEPEPEPQRDISSSDATANRAATVRDRSLTMCA
jgi:hypothetical protein